MKTQTMFMILTSWTNCTEGYHVSSRLNSFYILWYRFVRAQSINLSINFSLATANVKSSPIYWSQNIEKQQDTNGEHWSTRRDICTL